MKYLVIGCDGQLGFEFMQCANKYNYNVIGLTHKNIDITDEKNLNLILNQYDFDVIINTAAYHGNNAYKDKNPEKHYKVNSFGPYFLAKYCKIKNKIFVHYSTDYVFSGNKEPINYFFKETDFPIPTNLYGASKLSGETLIKTVSGKNIIFRVASLFGQKGCKAKGYDNFIETIIRKYNNNEIIEVVDDIFMTPTSTELVIRVTKQIIDLEKYDTYHLVSSDNCSWLRFANSIFNKLNFDTNKLVPKKSIDIEQNINRGHNTSLNNKKLKKLGIVLPTWDNMLFNYLKKEI